MSTAWTRVLGGFGLALGLLAPACSKEEGKDQQKPGASAATSPLDRRRILASVHYVNSRLEEPRQRDEVLRAVDEARECVRLSGGAAVDDLNLAICLLRQFDDRRTTSVDSAPAPTAIDEGPEKVKPILLEAIALLTKVRAARPDLAAAHFHAAMAQARRGKLEAADPDSDWQQKLLDAAKAYLALEDRSSALRYHVGTIEFKAGRYADAERSLRRAIELDPNHPNAYYSLGQSIARQNDPNKRGELGRIFETHRNLQETIGKQRAQWDPDATFDPAFPELLVVAPSGPVPAVEGATRFEAVEAPGPAAFALPILRGDPAIVPGALSQSGDPSLQARPALLAFAPGGGVSFWRLEGGRLVNANEKAPAAVAAECGAVCDLDGDHFVDALLGTPKGIVWLRALGPKPTDGFESKVPDGLAAATEPVADLAAADLDADGDLDLLVIERAAAGARVRVFQNDAASTDAPADTPTEDLTFTPRFSEAPAGAGIAAVAPAAPLRILLADFDDDNDTDVCIVGKAGSALFSNRRGFQFEKAADLPGAEDGAAGDVDGDGLPDVVLAGDSGIRLCASDGRAMRAPATLRGGPLRNPRIALADLENRGSLDIVGFAENAVTVLRHQGGGKFEEIAPRLFPGGFSGKPRAIAVADLDGDYDLDLLVAREGAPAVAYRNVGTERSPAVAVTFRGTKTNRAGIGAKVEARAGGLRVRREVWSLPCFIGVGPRPRVEGVFLRWTNGIDEAMGDVPTGKYLYAIEKRGREGSCPFLYSWDGEKFAFVTDALGATPLGLYAAPNLWVPPQDREWLRIGPGKLVPKEGRYELRFTEEMREATYLDRVRLLCVDHPAGTSVYPDERFCFPPFPPKRTLRVTRELPIRAARSYCGDPAGAADVTDLLLSEDRRFARPPRRIAYQGMCPEHVLELDLGALPAGVPVRLFLTGWFAWTNSSINRAIAFAGIRFTPPRIDVKGAEGWRTIVPDAGFPAGMQKTMCIDLGGKLAAGEHVVRLVTNLDLNWDRAFVSLDDDDPANAKKPFEPRVTELAPVAAELRWRGSAKWDLVDGKWPTEPNYANATGEAVYDLHVGDYTRYGDVLPLLERDDDQTVIFHHGDEVALAFDAAAAPPLEPGMVRTFYLDSSGWAKDMDPNTFAPSTLEPLPFHGMSGYPYGPSEHYPNDPEHQKYRAEWNTRRVAAPRPLPVRVGIEAIHKQ